MIRVNGFPLVQMSMILHVSASYMRANTVVGAPLAGVGVCVALSAAGHALGVVMRCTQRVRGSA